ncbi:MAG: CUAEP/CCAEP-tail radical SAM (seleno)protein [Acidiferrobacteraceae bacterium]
MHRTQVLLVNLYELGRQPAGLAGPAAWLRRAGHEVICLDLSLEKVGDHVLTDVALVALSIPMYTATRLAVEVLPRLRAAAPAARFCAYGLYAPLNAAFLRSLGVEAVLGGDCEQALVELADTIVRTRTIIQPDPPIRYLKHGHLAPDRTTLLPLTRYAHLKIGAERRTVGFADASRGCKHLCRHCPVVPIYEGRFSIVPVDLVLADIRAQVQAGARHISFGDPDFFNGPGHAERIVRALHAEFPEVTYDATIKIEHLVHESSRLPVLKETGCLFVTSAVESVDDEVLVRLDKGHTRADFARAVALMRATGIDLAPTFVPFTPWTTCAGYLDLLHTLDSLGLVEAVPPVQLAIRLLIPEGSRLLSLPDFRARLKPFDPALLGYPWDHEDPSVDALQQQIQRLAATDVPRTMVFAEIWQIAHAAAGVVPTPDRRHEPQPEGPRLSEPWYCCAEPVTSGRDTI